ncbi:hypothetical protein CBR_g17171 [Chara braunii]|uniref:Uncharacterized protein n=1 Tax=Chara braunii TaxID=69332 RepID=A0A388KV63_CHABU|nr:hypothetical protein CBR_g17171 [Chara braunii]|eukprot:GBG73833.1 hypothetical protein CBR_g17171 [Chara braunii]
MMSLTYTVQSFPAKSVTLDVRHHFEQGVVVVPAMVRAWDLAPRVETLPWLYYFGDANGWLLRTNIASKVSFTSQGSESGRISDIIIVLSQYSLNGTWLGFQNLTGQLQLCDTKREAASEWVKFGTNFINECEMKLEEIEQLSSEPVFYDAYLLDGKDTLYPVPVRVLNYRDQGRLINVNHYKYDEFDDVLTRRFFLSDFVSGKALPDAKPGIVRYLKSFQLTIKLRDDAMSRIYPPLITVDYATRDARFGNSVSHKVSFKVFYRMMLTNFWHGWMVLLVIAGVCAGLMWSFRMFRFLRTRQSQNFDLEDDFIHPHVVKEACLPTIGSPTPISVTLGDDKTQRFFDQMVTDLPFFLTLEPTDRPAASRHHRSSAHFDVMETGYDFIPGTPWSRRFRSTEADWATNIRSQNEVWTDVSRTFYKYHYDTKPRSCSLGAFRAHTISHYYRHLLPR